MAKWILGPSIQLLVIVSGSAFLWFRDRRFCAGIALSDYDPEAMDVSRQYRHGDIAFESFNPVIRAQIQTEMLQSVDRRFHC